jgi:hypothetical protein
MYALADLHPSTIRYMADQECQACNTEQGWYLHGCADRAEGRRIDQAQAEDEYYGDYYLDGYYGHPFRIR